MQSSEDENGTRFVRASRWLGTWRVETEEVALGKLVPRYLAAYGPSTFREVLRWWGVTTVVTMKPIIAALGDTLTEVEVDGTRAYVRTEDLDAIESDEAAPGARSSSSAASTRSSSAPGCATSCCRRRT